MQVHTAGNQLMHRLLHTVYLYLFVASDLPLPSRVLLGIAPARLGRNDEVPDATELVVRVRIAQHFEWRSWTGGK